VASFWARTRTGSRKDPSLSASACRILARSRWRCDATPRRTVASMWRSHITNVHDVRGDSEIPTRAAALFDEQAIRALALRGRRFDPPGVYRTLRVPEVPGFFRKALAFAGPDSWWPLATWIRNGHRPRRRLSVRYNLLSVSAVEPDGRAAAESLHQARCGDRPRPGAGVPRSLQPPRLVRALGALRGGHRRV